MPAPTKRVLAASAGLLSVLLLASMPEAHATGLLDSIQQSMQAASSGWMNQAEGYAKGIFGSLAAIELSWAGAQYALQKNDLSDMMASFLLKILALGFFFTLLTFAPSWMPDIINSFSQMGQSIGGGGAVATPSGIFSQGISISTALINSLTSPSFSFKEIAAYLFDDIIVGLAAIIVVAAYAFIALQLLMTLVESYFVIGGGVVMMGFLGSRWTAPFGEKYFGYAVSVGVKLLVLYLIVGFGSSFASHEITLINKAAAAAGGMPPPQAYLDTAMGSLVFGGMAWNVPNLAGSFLNGTPNLSLGNMAAPAAGMGAGIVAAGAAATGGLAKLAAATTSSAGGWKGGPDAAGGIGGMERLASLTGSANMPSAGASVSGAPSGSSSTSPGGGSGPAAAPIQRTFDPRSTTPSRAGGDMPGTTPARAAPQQTAAANAPENKVADPEAPQPGAAGLRKFAARMDDLKMASGSRALHHATSHDGNAGGMSIRLNHPD